MRRFIRKMYLPLLLAAPAAAQSDIPMAKPETVGMSAKRLERIHAFIQDYIDTNQIAGAVTLVARTERWCI